MGMKYNRMALFECTYSYYEIENDEIIPIKEKDKTHKEWNSFTPILPRFPYHLRLEITKGKWETIILALKIRIWRRDFFTAIILSGDNIAQ